MNINFEEFANERNMWEFVESVIPKEYGEVYVAYDQQEGKRYIFYDEYDLVEWMKEFIASNAPDREIEHEINDWNFSLVEMIGNDGDLIERKLGMDVDYSYDLNLYESVFQERVVVPE